jgi:hypothetical protein
MKCCWIRRILVGIPTVMLLCIAGLFCCELASVGYSNVAKVFMKDARGNVGRGLYNSYASSPVSKSLNVAHFVSYSVAASLLVASTGFACKCCSNSGGCKVTPPPVE